MNIDPAADRRILEAFRQTPDSIARAKAQQQKERLAAGVDLETGRPMLPPMVVCTGWIVPHHPPIILKPGDSTRMSHGMCEACSTALEAQMPREGDPQ